jgi:hypothetical protein
MDPEIEALLAEARDVLDDTGTKRDSTAVFGSPAGPASPGESDGGGSSSSWVSGGHTLTTQAVAPTCVWAGGLVDPARGGGAYHARSLSCVLRCGSSGARGTWFSRWRGLLLSGYAER